MSPFVLGFLLLHAVSHAGDLSSGTSNVGVSRLPEYDKADEDQKKDPTVIPAQPQSWNNGGSLGAPSAFAAPPNTPTSGAVGVSNNRAINSPSSSTNATARTAASPRAVTAATNGVDRRGAPGNARSPANTNGLNGDYSRNSTNAAANTVLSAPGANTRINGNGDYSAQQLQLTQQNATIIQQQQIEMQNAMDQFTGNPVILGQRARGARQPFVPGERPKATGTVYFGSEGVR